jgi:hypothetical protein
MPDLLIESPAGAPFMEVHIWIAHYAAGGESMIAADIPLPGGLGMRHMPLMNGRRHVAESLAPLARRIQSASQHASERIVRLELRTFRAMSS